MNRSYPAIAMTLVSLCLVPSFARAVEHTVEMRDNIFVPESLTVEEGDTVTWVHVSFNPHTATSGVNCTSDGLFDSGLMANGDTFSAIFEEAGPFPYYCIPHCGIGMTGDIQVEPAGGCTDDDGDGFAQEGGVCGSVDCDDTNPLVNPGQAELPGDGIDNNCNGQIDEPAAPCGIVHTGTGASPTGAALLALLVGLVAVPAALYRRRR